MAITKSGQLWHGVDAADLEEYLRDYSADNYPVARIVQARCALCQGERFEMIFDDEEGFASRCCTACGELFVMLDSAEVFEAADPGYAGCPCGGDVFNVSVGFAYREDGEVCWVYVGLRCTKDGALGVCAEWKIDYSPTAGLLKRV